MAEKSNEGKLPSAMMPEESCKMGEHVMDANVEKRLWAQRMVRSSNWRVAMAEYMRSLEKKQGGELATASLRQGVGSRE